MSNYLGSKKGSFIISSAATPTTTEIQNNIFSTENINVEYESIAGENSGRSDDGVMHIDWVLRRCRKVKITLPPSTGDKVSKILNLVQGKEYYITFWDMLKNAEMTIKVYTSTSSGEMYSGVLYNGLWTGVSFNAIELGGTND